MQLGWQSRLFGTGRPMAVDKVILYASVAQWQSTSLVMMGLWVRFPPLAPTESTNFDMKFVDSLLFAEIFFYGIFSVRLYLFKGLMVQHIFFVSTKQLASAKKCRQNRKKAKKAVHVLPVFRADLWTAFFTPG